MGITIILSSILNAYSFKLELMSSAQFFVNSSRIFASFLFMTSFYSGLYLKVWAGRLQMMRDFAPFLFILVIYFNIQDVIYLFNPEDIHYRLLDWDNFLFGIQPTVWIEQFYHPRLTDWFALTYLNYYIITLVLLFILYRKARLNHFRTVMVTMMISYYIGFVCYLFFPASSPYLVIPHYYAFDIWENTSFISWLTYTLVDLSPHRVRDAFPSMHNGIVLLTMIMAWRYHRTYFWIQLPLAISLPMATIYLRYHYAVDLIAALPVIGFALVLTPWLEEKWQAYQQHLFSIEKTSQVLES